MIEHFDPVKGRELLSLAVKSVDKLTERERLGILNLYSLNVEHNIPKGIEYARMRIELYPDDAVARNNLGFLYQSSGHYENALKEYKATVRVSPKMSLTYGGIEWIYLTEVGKMDSALVWAGKMLSDNPGSKWGYFYLGSAYLGLDSLSGAETAFRKAYEIDPDFLLNTYRLAHTCRVGGHYNEAIDLLTKVQNKHKDETSTFYDLGINYESMGNKKEALKYYTAFKKIATEEWLKTYPDMPETYIAIGAITARLGDLVSSRKALQKAIEMDSTKHEKFAELLCLQGRITDAQREIEKALKKGYRDLVWLKTNPDYQALQNEEGFRDLLKKYFK
jgi:superkiller protein 3